MNTDLAYTRLLQYVKRNRYNSTFDTNTLRAKMSGSGIQPKQVGGLISRAIRDGIIQRIGSTLSSNPDHKSGEVGVYQRGERSYSA